MKKNQDTQNKNGSKPIARETIRQIAQMRKKPTHTNKPHRHPLLQTSFLSQTQNKYPILPPFPAPPHYPSCILPLSQSPIFNSFPSPFPSPEHARLCADCPFFAAGPGSGTEVGCKKRDLGGGRGRVGWFGGWGFGGDG